MSHSVDLPDADLVRIVAFLDGTLLEPDARAFELRLGRESALARAFEELAEMDGELRAALASRAVPQGGPTRIDRRPWIMGLAAAAGILLALAAVLWLRAGAHPRAIEDFQIALVETAPSDAGFNELLGFDPDWLPLGMGYRSGSPDAAPPADEFVREVDAAFGRRVAQALATEAVLERADSFLLAFRPSSACYVVLLVEQEGRARRLLLPLQVPGTLYRPEKTYLLPDDPLELPEDWRESQRVEFDPGILTRAGAKVTVAVRGEPLDVEQLRELRELLVRLSDSVAPDPPALATWFAERDFTTRRLRVGAY